MPEAEAADAATWISKSGLKTNPGTQALEDAAHLDHVHHGDALRDAHDQRAPRVEGLENGIGSKRRRHEDHGCVGAGLLNCIGYRIKNPPAFVRGSTFTRSYAADDLGAVFSSASGVERAFFAGNSLNDQSSVLVY